MSETGVSCSHFDLPCHHLNYVWYICCCGIYSWGICTCICCWGICIGIWKDSAPNSLLRRLNTNILNNLMYLFWPPPLTMLLKRANYRRVSEWIFALICSGWGARYLQLILSRVHGHYCQSSMPSLSWSSPNWTPCTFYAVISPFNSLFFPYKWAQIEWFWRMYSPAGRLRKIAQPFLIIFH